MDGESLEVEAGHVASDPTAAGQLREEVNLRRALQGKPGPHGSFHRFKCLGIDHSNPAYQVALIGTADSLGIEDPFLQAGSLVRDFIGRVADGSGPDHVADQRAVAFPGRNTQDENRPHLALVSEIRQPEFATLHGSSRS